MFSTRDNFSYHRKDFVSTGISYVKARNIERQLFAFRLTRGTLPASLMIHIRTDDSVIQMHNVLYVCSIESTQKGRDGE